MLGMSVSLAVRVCVAAYEEGIDLSGAAFLAGASEALTERGLGVATGIVRTRCQVADLADLPLLRTVSVDGLVFDLHHVGGDLDSFVVRLGLPHVLS